MLSGGFAPAGEYLVSFSMRAVRSDSRKWPEPIFVPSAVVASSNFSAGTNNHTMLKGPEADGIGANDGTAIVQVTVSLIALFRMNWIARGGMENVPMGWPTLLGASAVSGELAGAVGQGAGAAHGGGAGVSGKGDALDAGGAGALGTSAGCAMSVVSTVGPEAASTELAAAELGASVAGAPFRLRAAKPWAGSGSDALTCLRQLAKYGLFGNCSVRGPGTVMDTGQSRSESLP